MKQTQLLVIGAGPYALSAAALAQQHGIDTVVLGRPMGFWRQNMPEGMFLRSGPHRRQAKRIRVGCADPLPPP